MKKKKLGINTAAGILDVINIILVIGFWLLLNVSIFLLFYSKALDAFLNNLYVGINILEYVTLGTGLILHIIALFQSRKAGISIVGHVIGIIGCAIILLFMHSTFATFITYILLIFAAFFTLKQKQVKQANPSLKY